MIETRPKLRHVRSGMAGTFALALVAGAIASTMVAPAASAQSAANPAAGAATTTSVQAYSSQVVDWGSGPPPVGVVLPGTVVAKTSKGAKAGTASSSAPATTAPAPGGSVGVVVIGASAPTNASAPPAAPSDELGDDTGVVTVAAVTRAPDALALTARVALEALRSRSLVAAPAPIPSSVPSPAPVAGGAGGVQSVIVSSDAIESALAGMDPVVGDRSFAAVRSKVAALVAERAKVNAAALDAVWARTDERRMTAVLAALAQVGTMYRYAGNQPGGFDCSGLTSYAWSVAGVKIPRTSAQQAAAMIVKDSSALLPGDLLWRPGHIGMYLGIGDVMVHAPQTGKAVQVRDWGRIERFGSPF